MTVRYKIQIQNVNTILLEILLDSKSIYIYFNKIYYCCELSSNLLFLVILEKKEF